MRSKKILCAALCGVFACLLAGYALVRWLPSVSADGGRLIAFEEGKLYPVSYVYDGDTFAVKVGSRRAKVRMLGIDTPETIDPRKPVQCYGPESSAETRSLLEGRTVRLVASPKREARDMYGRYLFYVYRDDGLFVNESLLTDGFAREYTYGTPYSMQSEFRGAETGAKEARKGLWGTCGLGS